MAASKCKKILFVAVILLQAGTSVPVHLSMTALPHKMTQLDTELECGNLSKKSKETWALPNGRESAKKLASFMLDQNLSAVWLGIRRSSRESWQWVNGSKDERFKDAEGVRGCAVLGLNHIIKPNECADESQGFICEIPNATSCLLNQNEGFCTDAHKKHYWFRCQARNWFSARSACKGRGGDLAIIQNKEIKDIIQPIGANELLRCNSFYIGLHREYWLRTTPIGGMELVEQENWAMTEPANKDCAIFVVDPSSQLGVWRAEECFSKKPGLCEQYNEMYEETTSPGGDRGTPCMNVTKLICSSSHSDCKETKRGLIAVGVVLTTALIIMLATTYYYYKRHRRKKNGQPEPVNRHPHQGERHYDQGERHPELGAEGEGDALEMRNLIPAQIRANTGDVNMQHHPENVDETNLGNLNI